MSPISKSSDDEVPLMHSMNEDIITNEIKNIALKIK